jgi:hypothetical protein
MRRRAMVDRTKLKEALEGWVQEYVWILQRHAPQVTLEPLEEVVAAARAVVEAPEMKYCKVHEDIAMTMTDCWRKLAVRNFDESCRMVRVFLVPAEEEK